ncbi:MAG: hypothetical protein AB7T08_08625, partial [Hyphomonadaceae bacterium]
MRILIAIAALGALFACSQPAQQGESQTVQAASDTSAPMSDPVSVVRPLYDRYLTPNSQFAALEDSAPWTDEMRAEIVAMNARSEAMGEPILDFDPFINAQDWQIASVNVTADSVVRDSHAVVRASFENMGRPTEIVFDLEWRNNG